MATLTFFPTDTTAIASSSCISTPSCGQSDTDTITVTGFPVLPGYDVRIHVTCSASASCSSAAFEGSNGRGAVEYAPVGAGWTPVAGKTFQCSCATVPEDSCAQGSGSSLVVVLLGDMDDISLIQIRCDTDASGEANSDGQGDAQITDWFVTIEAPIAIIGE